MAAAAVPGPAVAGPPMGGFPTPSWRDAAATAPAHAPPAIASAVLEPLLAAQVAELCNFRDVRFQVDDVRSGSLVPRCLDRFTVTVPCCSQRLRWHVLFNAERPLQAPDVIFPEGDSSFQPLLLPLTEDNDGIDDEDAGDEGDGGYHSNYGRSSGSRSSSSMGSRNGPAGMAAGAPAGGGGSRDGGAPSISADSHRQPGSSGDGGCDSGDPTSARGGGREPSTPTSTLTSASAAGSLSWSLLRSWHPGDKTRLLRLILTLRQMYMQHQRALAECVADPRVRFELSTLAHTEGTEVCVVQSGPAEQRTAEEVQMAVPIQGLNLQSLAPFASLSSLLAGGAAATPSKGSASSRPCNVVLQVRFLLHAPTAIGPSGVSAAAAAGANKPPAPLLKLEGPPLLLDLLGLVDFRLPTWTDTACLLEYVPQVVEHVEVKVREAAAGLHARADFVAALEPVLGEPLETDTVLFLRTSCFVNHGPFLLLVHITLSPSFPKVQPTLQLQSMQHYDAVGCPFFSLAFSSYPWSPRWRPAEMAARVAAFVGEEMARFKAACAGQ